MISAHPSLLAEKLRLETTVRSPNSIMPRFAYHRTELHPRDHKTKLPWILGASGHYWFNKKALAV